MPQAQQIAAGDLYVACTDRGPAVANTRTEEHPLIPENQLLPSELHFCEFRPSVSRRTRECTECNVLQKVRHVRLPACPNIIPWNSIHVNSGFSVICTSNDTDLDGALLLRGDVVVVLAVQKEMHNCRGIIWIGGEFDQPQLLRGAVTDRGSVVQKSIV